MLFYSSVKHIPPCMIIQISWVLLLIHVQVPFVLIERVQCVFFKSGHSVLLLVLRFIFYIISDCLSIISTLILLYKKRELHSIFSTFKVRNIRESENKKQQINKIWLNIIWTKKTPWCLDLYVHGWIMHVNSLLTSNSWSWCTGYFTALYVCAMYQINYWSSKHWSLRKDLLYTLGTRNSKMIKIKWMKN
jgi:hypothetical protein